MGNSIIEDMKHDEWLTTSEKREKEKRILFLKSFIKPINHTCPECNHKLTSNEDEIYCEQCGLIVSASIKYVAGQKIRLDYGIKL